MEAKTSDRHAHNHVILTKFRAVTLLLLHMLDHVENRSSYVHLPKLCSVILVSSFAWIEGFTSSLEEGLL